MSAIEVLQLSVHYSHKVLDRISALHYVPNMHNAETNKEHRMSLENNFGPDLQHSLDSLRETMHRVTEEISALLRDAAGARVYRHQVRDETALLQEFKDNEHDSNGDVESTMVKYGWETVNDPVTGVVVEDDVFIMTRTTYWGEI